MNERSGFLYLIIFFVTVVASIAQTAFALDKRSSVATGKIGFGSEQTRSQSMSLGIGLSNSLLLNGGLSHFSDENSLDTFSFSVGPDFMFSDSLSINGNLLRESAPNDTTGNGLSVGLSWLVSSLWGSDLSTKLMLDQEFLRYTQSVATANNSTTPKLRKIRNTLATTDLHITQGKFGVGISQEVTSTVQLGASFSRYSYYGSDPALLYNAIGTRNVLETFLQNSFELSLSVDVYDFLTLSSFVSKSSSYLFSDSISTYSISGTYLFHPSWSITPEVSHSGATGENGSNSIALGLTYEWL